MMEKTMEPHEGQIGRNAKIRHQILIQPMTIHVTAVQVLAETLTIEK